MSDFKLDNHPKLKPGFNVPDGYFDSFAERLAGKLTAAQQPKVVPLYRRRPLWLSAAAVFIVLLGLGIFFKTLMPEPETAQPDAEAIENYLVYQQGITSYDLLQNLDVQDIKELEASINTIPDEAIEEYLSTEDVYLME